MEEKQSVYLAGVCRQQVPPQQKLIIPGFSFFFLIDFADLIGMAVAGPCCKKEWGEWKREMEEKRRRRWTEKVSCWANLKVSDEEEEEEEVEEWEEGEDDSDVSEPPVREEEEMEGNERAIDGKVEEGLRTADDDEEERQLEQTGDRMEQEQERAQDQMKEEDRGAEPQTWLAEPQVMEEDEEAEGEQEVREGAGAGAEMVTADVKVHTDEEERELEQTGENNQAGRDDDDRSSMDEDEGADNYREEDWSKDRTFDEERAEISNEQNNENSLLEAHHKFTEDTETLAQFPTDDLKDPEEEEETDEEEASDDEEEDRIYSVDNYPTEIFSALTDFRDTSLLTDLTLSTVDGSRWSVHAVVLAAVSSRIFQSLRERSMEDGGINIHLGPEVDAVGLAAVVEFAYAGFISALHADTKHQVEIAAGALGACRVMELCRQSV